MKKLFTFFAVMFALLGFPNVGFAESWYVVGDFNGWSTTHNPMTQSGNTYSATVTFSESGKQFRLYRSDGGHYVGSGSNDNTANINGSSGTIQMWYSDHTEGGAIEIKKAGTYKLDFNRSDNKLSYTEVTQATTPYIFVDGSSKPFTKSGSNWVYTVDASTADKVFRLQNANDNTALSGTSGMKNIVLSCSNLTIDSNGSRLVYKYGDNGGNFTAKSGAIYRLSFSTSADFNGSGAITLTITRTEVGIPKPVFVHATNSNVVTINVPTGCTLHYTLNGGGEQTATSTVNLPIPAAGLTVSAYFTKEGESGQGETVTQTFQYYTAPQRWASKEWSLSDDLIMPRGTVKYFYLSRYQNDDRVSPEWELTQSGNTYTLDYFMCIPAAEFRLRRIAKDASGNLSYRDFGLDNVSKITPTSIGATSTTVGTAAAPKTVSKSYTLYGGSYGNKGRGYAWDFGYSMVSVKITDTTDGSNSVGPQTLTMTLSVDFSRPSTANVAPIKGMPYVALTGSKLQIPTIEGQNIKHATDLPDGYSNAFTNAWIQYDEESNMLMYGDNVTNNALYHGNSYHAPEDGAVMNSTILPPRYPIWFKLIDEDGNETNVTSNKTVLKYKGKETRKFKNQAGNSTKDNVEFAVYALNDMEMAGLFKIYSGYGGYRYGSVENGLSLHSNWGVGHQPDTKPYDYSVIPSGVAMPLNGGGPKTKADGTAERDPSKSTTEEPYTVEDNYAGRYFGFDKRTYVSELNFYYALEPDVESVNLSNPLVGGGGQDENTNSHHADDATMNVNNPTNDGRNFSWFRFVYEGLFGKIDLKKEGFNTGRVTWSINDVENPELTKDKILNYQVTFYPVAIDAPQGQASGKVTTVVGKQAPQTPDTEKCVKTAFQLEPDLEQGWYEAKLEYWVDTYDEDGNALPNQYKVAYSPRILVFQMAASAITAKQRVTTTDDGVRVYHPVIDVTPDATSSIQALDPSTDVTTVYADITIDGISNTDVCVILDKDDEPFATTADGTNPYVVYDYANRKATVYYPQGYFKSRIDIPGMSFAVRNAAINEYTDFSMTINSIEGSPATSTTKALVYMPAGKLYGKLIAQAVKDNDNVKFNALAVTNEDELPEGENPDGYARIRYVDKNNNDEPCFISTMGGTSVMAKVTYVATDDAGVETPKVLFAGEKLNMLFNPDDADGIYTSKRLKVAGIPYKTEQATDAAGETISVRKDQEAIFDVELTYSIDGYDDFVARELRTTLEYNASELTSPRNGLADLKTKDDQRGATTTDGKSFATDVTAVTESFVENYGGLFTNIEDAHVALQAVDPNEELVHEKTYDKWYMDHGDKWDNGTVNPHNPAAHRAIGNAKRGEAGSYAAPEEVHPLLRGKYPLTGTTTGDNGTVYPNGFRNDSEVNNAWWNERAAVAPEFHVADHIKGDFERDKNGNITSWKPESSISKPAHHREYWAGVKAGNDEAYKVFDGSTVIKVEDLQTGKKKDVDIRDPQHSYYGMNSHFSSTEGLRTAFHLGEMPLNANDIVAFYGDGTLSDNSAANDPKGVAQYLGDFNNLRSVAIPIHNNMSEVIAKAKYKEDGKVSVTIDGESYTLDIPLTEPWNIDNVWKARAELAFKTSSIAGGVSPAEAIFEAANNHMIFKVRHVNHESWFVPGGGLQHDYKTRPLWDAFKDVNVGGKTIDDFATDKEKDNFVMSVLRMNFDDYCPLAYDVRYTYPFLTTEKVTAENYNNSAIKARSATDDFQRINNMYAAVTPADVTNVAARDTGRVPFFDGTTTSPDEVVPTAISDVNDDIRGAGFSIVYNRAAGTVTITADGDRELKDAAVYDATGASLVMGTSADRVDDQTIVLDVRNIARGAYVVSTNLGGAKFMK